MIEGYDYIGIGVGVILFNNLGEIFLAKRGRLARNEVGYWEFPGGGVNFGETLENAVKREMFEEFGVNMRVERLLGVFDHILLGENQHWISVTFIGTHISGTPQIMEPEKCEGIGWFAIQELPSPLSSITQQNLAIYLSSQDRRSK